MPESIQDILSRLLQESPGERSNVLDQLFEEFEPHFRAIAAKLIPRDSRADLSPDELLNEFVLRFIGDSRSRQLPSIAGFWVYVARRMREILIEDGRRRRSASYDGTQARVAERKHHSLPPFVSSPEGVYQIVEAINLLPDQQSAMAAYVVLDDRTTDESARLLDLSYDDAAQIWKTAKRNLGALLGRSNAPRGVDPEHLLPTPLWRRHHWCEWQLTLDGSIDQFTRDMLVDTIVELRKFTLDETLNVLRIGYGSIILLLDGSREGFEIISSLVASGQVKEVLGRRIEEVRLLEIGPARSLLLGQSKSWCGLFMSYAHADARLQQKLKNHLMALEREGLITAWYDRKIRPGKDWRQEIQQHLEASNIILLLISASFIASEYCYGVELRRAMERHEARSAMVVPILLRPVSWENLSFGRLHALPTNGKPISRWPNRDEAFKHITEEIRILGKQHRDSAGPSAG